jgi:bifunctional non-homologous end joining protein LigD
MASLKTYVAKRDFSKTREPRGKKHVTKGRSFVIQKHAATRLHYDLRLELDGVMLSWAVTKGPSLVPGEKRLAIHVEDHPIEYNKFEGTIPKGQYGGGTVMIWDRGKWFPEGDPHKGLAKGHLDFRLEGEKLKGRWHLVRMSKRPGERQEPWLLIKSKDEAAYSKTDPDILEEKSESVVTGRSIEQIAAAADRVWHSNRSAKDQPDAKTKSIARAKPRPRAPRSRKAAAQSREGAKKKKASSAPFDFHPAAIQGARKAAFPEFIPPCLASLSAKPPDGGDWVHEIKFDGYRIQGRRAGQASLKTRKGLDWTEKFRPIADALMQLPAQRALIDGEIVVQDKKGISNFSELQESLKAGHCDRFIYYVFDLLYLDGFDLTGAALADRKDVLQKLVGRLPAGTPIQFSEHFTSDGSVLLNHACKMELEGIVSKKARAPYHSGRIGDWLKTKCSANQEFVIAGYEPSATQSRSIRALILGYYDSKGLHYAGRVGTGFKVATERDLMARLEKLRTDKMPYDKVPEEERRRRVQWVEPKLVAEIDFRGWTHGNVLRQASFKGLREDKPAKEVVRETGATKVAAASKRTASKASAKKLSQKKPEVSIAGVALTHPDRVYWDDVGVTKKMLAEYYEQVWDWMAPHLIDRPLALVRCPEGATAAKCFFQKHASAGLEKANLKRIPVKGEEPWIAVEDLSGLIALAQAGVLEIHTWGTTADEIDTCNRLVFDLDPGPGITWKQLLDGARDVKARLEAIGLETFLKTTGGKGLHVVVPIAPTDWDAAKDFAHAIALSMAADDPARYVATMAKKLRDNRIFVDYLRNGKGATAIAPYSTRARPGATVSVPLAWEELSKLNAPNTFNVLNLMKRLKKLRRDPWKDIGRIQQKLPAASRVAKGRRA